MRGWGLGTRLIRCPFATLQETLIQSSNSDIYNYSSHNLPRYIFVIFATNAFHMKSWKGALDTSLYA